MKIRIYSFWGILSILTFSCGKDHHSEVRLLEMERDSLLELAQIKDSILNEYQINFAKIENTLHNFQQTKKGLFSDQKSIKNVKVLPQKNLNPKIRNIMDLIYSNQKAFSILNTKFVKSQVELNHINKKNILLSSQIVDKTNELENVYSYLLTKNKTISELNKSLQRNVEF